MPQGFPQPLHIMLGGSELTHRYRKTSKLTAMTVNGKSPNAKGSPKYNPGKLAQKTDAPGLPVSEQLNSQLSWMVISNLQMGRGELVKSPREKSIFL